MTAGNSRCNCLTTGVLAGFVAAVIGATEAAAQETRATQQDQTAVAVTIYNENLALVKDRRKVQLDAGAQGLAFVDVSAQMRPETALLHSDGGKLGVLEQNFEFDLGKTSKGT